MESNPSTAVTRTPVASRERSVPSRPADTTRAPSRCRRVHRSPPASWIAVSPKCSCGISAARSDCNRASRSSVVSCGSSRTRTGTVLMNSPPSTHCLDGGRASDTVVPNTTSVPVVISPSRIPHAACSTVLTVTPARSAVPRQRHRSRIVHRNGLARSRRQPLPGGVRRDEGGSGQPGQCPAHACCADSVSRATSQVR